MSATVDEILAAGVEKHSRFNKAVDMKAQHVLLYTDRTPVFNIPGTDEPFTLQGYREATGKPYSKLIFYFTDSINLYEGKLSCIKNCNEKW